MKYKSIITSKISNTIDKLVKRLRKTCIVSGNERKYEIACVRVRACDKHTAPSRRNVILPIPPSPSPSPSPRSAIVSLGDNPWTTWQVKFCIHGSAGNIGARLNEPLYLLLWFQRGPPTAEEYSFKYLSILELDAAAYPGDGLMCPAAAPRVLCARILSCMWTHTQVHATPMSDLCRRYSRSTFTIWPFEHPSVSMSLDFSGKVFFVYKWQPSNWILKVYVIDHLTACIS